MTPNISKCWSLKTRITAVTLAVFVIGIWSLVFYTSRMLRADMQNLLADQQASTVSLVASEIDHELAGRILALEKITSLIDQPILNNPRSLQQLLDRQPILHEIFNAGVVAVMQDGTAIADIPVVAGRRGRNYADNVAIHAALTEGKVVIGSPVVGRVLRQPLFNISAPIRDTRGKVIGVLFGVINLAKPNFLDQIGKHRYGKSGGYLVMDPRHGLIVTATDKSRVLQPIPAPGINETNDRRRHGFDGSTVALNSLGVEVLSSSARVPTAGWYVIAALPTAEAFAPIHTMQQRILTAAVLLTLLAGGLTWWMLKRQLLPLMVAARTLSAMSDTREPLHDLPIACHDEIGHLISGFNRVLETLAQREIALKESEASKLAALNFNEQIFLASPIGIFTYQATGQCLTANRNAADQTGATQEQLLSQNFRQLGSWIDSGFLARAEATLATGEVSQIEAVVYTSFGRQVWLNAVFSRFFANQQPHLLLMTTDISLRKQKEQQTRRLLAENQTILGNALVGIVYLKQRRIVSCNRRFEEIFQYASGELIGESTERLYDTRDTFLGIGERAYSALGQTRSYSDEALLRHKDGSLFWGALNGCVIDSAHPDDGSIWIYADISERRRAEQESTKLLQAVEQSPISIVLTNREGVIEYVNPSFTRITGYSRSEIVGQTPRMLKSEHTPLTTHQELWRTILEGKVWRGVLRNRRKNGDLIWEDISIAPIFNDAGEITHFVGVKEDVTERKWIEQQLVEHQLHLEDLVEQRTVELSAALEAAKLADRSKNEFLANITHELRTPLSAVIGLAGLARSIITEPKPRDYMDKILAAGKHLNRIINELLDLSKIAAGYMEIETIDFSLRGLVLRCTSVMAHRAAEKNLELVSTIDNAVPDILLGDPFRLEQILLNLVGNAVKFTASGRVEVRIGLSAQDEDRVCLDIEVEDTGIGMRPEQLAQLFKPFSQADASVTRKFGGTGLGLTICKSLVELMGGEIGVTSQEGSGSTFRIKIWIGLGEAGKLPLGEENKEAAAQVRYHDVRVMVVDDQALNREVVEGLLSATGITAHLAENGQQALEILSRGAEAFDLVLMDIQMPVMDGLTATRAIRNLDGFAQLPIIAMTAHTMTHEKEKCSAAGMNDHIGKPFDEANFYGVLAKWIPQSKQDLQTVAASDPLRASGFPRLRGVDTQAGLALLQGDKARYRHWLSDFILAAPAAMAQVRHCLAAGQSEPASIAAHTLKGRMGLLGMKELHAIAAALEAAIDSAEPADELLLSLQEAVAAMCAEIQRVLGPAADAPPAAELLTGQLPAGSIPASVMRLIASLHAGDSDCDRYITDCLVELENTVWEPRLRQALIHAQNFDFAAAGRLLSDSQQEPVAAES